MGLGRVPGPTWPMSRPPKLLLSSAGTLWQGGGREGVSVPVKPAPVRARLGRGTTHWGHSARSGCRSATVVPETAGNRTSSATRPYPPGDPLHTESTPTRSDLARMRLATTLRAYTLTLEHVNGLSGVGKVSDTWMYSLTSCRSHCQQRLDSC